MNHSPADAAPNGVETISAHRISGEGPLDWITLTGLRASGHHGVLPEERRDGQEFVVDVALGLPLAGLGDDLARTVNYAEVAQRVHELVAGDPVDLIETLAERIADACLAFPLVRRVRVCVHKPHAPIPVPFADVTVAIERAASGRRTPVVLSLGSNLDDPLNQLRTAVADLGAGGVEVLSVSRVYRTAPVGHLDQPDFANITVLAQTALPPEALLARAHAIEAAHARRRVLVNGPRTLDIDIIAMGEQHRTDADHAPLIPHPRAHERAFVLVPWLEVDPGAELPGHGRVRDLVAGLDCSGVEVVGELSEVTSLQPARSAGVAHSDSDAGAASGGTRRDEPHE